MCGWFSEASVVRLALEAREPVRIDAKTAGRTLIATSRCELRVAGAIDLAHAAGAERATISYGPMCAPDASGMK